MKKSLGILTLLTMTLAATPALALKLGDDAPPLKVDKWLKGGPVNLTEGKGKNIYVVEFWATWCGPCKVSMPHLSKIQRDLKDKGVVVIGITSSDKSEQIAADFVKKQGETMDYVVAYESSEAKNTYKAFMEPFKAEGIPHSFVIDKQGKLVWEGHPMFGLDAVLDAVIKGDYTVASLKEVAAKAEEEASKKMAELNEAASAYFEVVAQADKLAESKEKGRELLKRADDNAIALNQIAWTILTDEEVKTRDLELALEAATRANDLSKKSDPSILDTYARALFDNGKIDEAIAAQKLAIEKAEGNKAMLSDLQQSLKKYEAAQKK